MTNFNITKLSDEQKGFGALILGTLMLLHVLNILQLNWIVVFISITLIIYGLIKTRISVKIMHFIKKQERQQKKH